MLFLNSNFFICMIFLIHIVEHFWANDSFTLNNDNNNNNMDELLIIKSGRFLMS